jgi:AAA15 family ATPase/GTPase
VCAIYGANAGGKSNVYQAFECMTDYVLDSFTFGGESDSKRASDYNYKRPAPFLLDVTSKDAESSFEVYFTDTNDPAARSYNYGFCVSDQGITEEWLNSKSKSAREYRRIFYRSKETLDLSGLPAKSRENIEVSLEKESLIVSLGAKLKIAKLKIVRDWFIKNEFADFGDPTETFFLSNVLPDRFVEDAAVQKDVLDYFSSFDASIKTFIVEEIPAETDKAKKLVRIDALHEMIGSDETAAIPFRSESDGTLKMFALYPLLQSVLENGGVFFVDELNARLHPLLVRNFAQTFLNPKLNPRNAQLVFTTHDTWQLSNDLLRRDEIWFTEKQPTGVTTLYSLADFIDEDGVKIRKDESYEKNYLLGKYGAIPSLKSFEIFEGK